MKYKTLLLAGIASCYGFGAIADEMSPYIGIKAGVAFERAKPEDRKAKVKETSKTQFVGSAEVGLAFKSKTGTLRTEIEYTYHPKYNAKYWNPGLNSYADVKLKIQQHTFMFNAYYEIPLAWWNISPYLGGGLGLNRASVSSEGEFKDGKKLKEKAKSLLAWNVTGGLAYNFNKNFAVDLGYRYMGAADYKSNDVKITLYNHQVYLGLRYTF